MENQYLCSFSTLIVGGSQSIRDELEWILQGNISKLFSAAGTRSGLQLFNKHQPDIIISVTAAPHEDGLELAAMVKKDYDWVSVIAIGDFSDQDVFKRSIEIGVDQYVLLPLDSSSLIKAVDKTERTLHESRSKAVSVSEERLLGTLLRLSLQPLSLRSYLQQALDNIVASVPWLKLLPKGAIFLAKERRGEKVLHLVAIHMLSPELHTLCAEVPFGYCLCGRAASEGQIQFSSCVDDRHKVRFAGMAPHGHYNVPILSGKEVVGVLVFYLPHGHVRSHHEESFLQRISDVLSMGISRNKAKRELIQAKERAEAATAQLVGITRNLPGLIFRKVRKPNGVETYPFVSLAAEAFLGYSAKELLEGAIDSLDLVVESDRAFCRKEVDRSMKELTPLSLEYRVMLKSGETRWVHCTAQPTSFEGGIVWDGLIEDINDRKLLEGQLVQAQKLESVGQLAAGIAHEINTPTQYVADNTHFLKEAFDELKKVVAVYGRFYAAAKQADMDADLIEEVSSVIEEVDLEFIEDEVPNALEQALEGLQKISIIVRAMKEFSHPGGDEMESVDLNSLIENTITVSKNEWKYVAQMETDLAPDLSAISGYRDKLSQVFLNLIVNAAHAIAGIGGECAEVEGAIRITTRNVGDAVEVRVSDNGPGVPEKLRARIFDPFFTTKEVGKGTGQGLSIVHSVVVDKHKGRLMVDESEQGGALFIIRLPAVAEGATTSKTAVV